MNVLIGCACSPYERDAFRARGHNAWSCDLKDAERGVGLGHLYHLKGDVRRVLSGTIPDDMVEFSHWRGNSKPSFIKWDLAIFHPECRRLCNSGVRWLEERNLWREMREAAAFFMELKSAPIPRKVVENSIPHGYAREIIGDYDQIIQPWQFGHREMKATCLWLENVPPLVETNNVGPPPKDRAERRKWAKVHQASPGPNRSADRARTLPGIADAMAAQWGNLW